MGEWCFGQRSAAGRDAVSSLSKQHKPRHWGRFNQLLAGGKGPWGMLRPREGQPLAWKGSPSASEPGVVPDQSLEEDLNLNRTNC